MTAPLPRRLLLLATLALAGCGDDATAPAADTAVAPDSSAELDTAPPEDTASVEDTAAIVDTSSQADTLCPPLSCADTCVHGRVQSAAGCPTCACRACNRASDCAPNGCASPTCTAEGACGCDCAASPPVPYACPDGTTVPHCACADGVWRCEPHPERACPTLCRPGDAEAWPCPDGASAPWCTCAADDACAPRCERVGEADEGFYDGCTGALVRKGACAGCEVAHCGAIGTRSEGWYSCAGELLGWFFCGPKRTCDADPGAHCTDLACVAGPTASFPCPGGEPVSFCGCEVPGAECPPVCAQVGAADEGWYDSCTGALVAKRTCGGCELSCDKVGSKSEGWYDSCDGLITWAVCATGTWACIGEPWERCGGD